MALTVGELRKSIEGVDDALEVVINENFEYVHWLANETSIEYTDGTNNGSLVEEKDFGKEDMTGTREFFTKVFTLLTI